MAVAPLRHRDVEVVPGEFAEPARVLDADAGVEEAHGLPEPRGLRKLLPPEGGRGRALPTPAPSPSDATASIRIDDPIRPPPDPPVHGATRLLGDYVRWEYRGDPEWCLTRRSRAAAPPVRAAPDVAPSGAPAEGVTGGRGALHVRRTLGFRLTNGDR